MPILLIELFSYAESTEIINSTYGKCLKSKTKPAYPNRTGRTITNYNQENVGFLSQFPGFTSSESSNASKSFTVENIFDTHNHLKQSKCISSVSKIINRDESLVLDNRFPYTNQETELKRRSMVSMFSDSQNSECSSSFSDDYETPGDLRSFLENISEEETNPEHSDSIIIERKSPKHKQGSSKEVH